MFRLLIQLLASVRPRTNRKLTLIEQLARSGVLKAHYKLP